MPKYPDEVLCGYTDILLFKEYNLCTTRRSIEWYNEEMTDLELMKYPAEKYFERLSRYKKYLKERILSNVYRNATERLSAAAIKTKLSQTSALQVRQKALTMALKSVFGGPINTSVIMDTDGRRTITYNGLAFKDEKENHVHIDLSSHGVILQPQPKPLFIIPEDTRELKRILITCETTGKVKEITINKQTKTWKLTFCKKRIDLTHIHLTDLFADEDETVRIVKSLQECQGRIVKDSDNANDWIRLGNNRARFRACTLLLPLNSKPDLPCVWCRTTFIKLKPQITIPEVEEDISSLLEKVFPDCTDDQKVLLSEQRKANIAKCHRWDPRVIRLCLSMYVAGRKSYEILRSSNMLKLPSGKTLQVYKNRVHQRPGVNLDMFRWMGQTARNMNIEKHGYAGGLIHDEMKIQSGLMIKMVKGVPQLVGFIDTGVESTLIHQKIDRTLEKEMATQVLQFMFLGNTGFRFPIAHYPTQTAKPVDYHTIIPDLLYHHQLFGFKVEYIMSDGGSEYRAYVNSLYNHPLKPKDLGYVTKNVATGAQLALIQDPMHCSKKFRNNIIKSGPSPAKGHTRHITLDGDYVTWQMWIDAVQWDRANNSRPIHYRITDEHLYPNPSQKMRNHLAVHCLDDNMLFLMRQYQSTLNDGSVVNGAIKLLEFTSKLIKLIGDIRPVEDPEDQRLNEMDNMATFIKEWRNKNDAYNLPSPQCLDDMQSYLLGFPNYVRYHLTNNAQSSVIISRTNSDHIENHFCQQRAFYNGANDNPDYLQYAYTTNSILIGQPAVASAKRSNAGVAGAVPYNASIKYRKQHR